MNLRKRSVFHTLGTANREDFNMGITVPGRTALEAANRAALESYKQALKEYYMVCEGLGLGGDLTPEQDGEILARNSKLKDAIAHVKAAFALWEDTTDALADHKT